MAIDFFDPNCTHSTSEKSFGIIDIPPATMNFDHPESWHTKVENPNSCEVNMTAIDDCLNIPWSEGKRCEAVLVYQKVLHFLELKDRDSGRWAGEARDQLSNTIRLFKENENLDSFERFYAQISNKQRPDFKAGGKAFSQ
jgi:hypothetical protein